MLSLEMKMAVLHSLSKTKLSFSHFPSNWCKEDGKGVGRGFASKTLNIYMWQLLIMIFGQLIHVFMEPKEFNVISYLI